MALFTHLGFSCQLNVVSTAPFRPFCPSSIRPFMLHIICVSVTAAARFFFSLALFFVLALFCARALCICGVVPLSFVCSFLCFRFERHCCVFTHIGRSHCKLSHIFLSIYHADAAGLLSTSTPLDKFAGFKSSCSNAVGQFTVLATIRESPQRPVQFESPRFESVRVIQWPCGDVAAFRCSNGAIAMLLVLSGKCDDLTHH